MPYLYPRPTAHFTVDQAGPQRIRPGNIEKINREQSLVLKEFIP